MPAPLQQSPWLHRFAMFIALSTLFLIGIGGLVTTKGVGMAVPDWPNTFGYNMFLVPFDRWIGQFGIFEEHAHRLVASFVGFLTMILAIWLSFSEPGLREREPNSQNHGQKAHKRSHQPVGVFLKNSKLTNPTVERHQKHVVTECVWPIWNRHPYTFCRHQSTYPNKKQCRQCDKHCEPVQPRALLQRSRHQKLNKNSKKGEVGQFLDSNRV